MTKKIFITLTALLLCFALALNSAVLAAENDTQTLAADSIKILRHCGIIKGETLQLQATIEPTYASVKWYSSNPDIISCTSTGEIKGIKSGGYADIYCESRFGSVKDKIRVYCVNAIYPTVKSGSDDLYFFIYSKPNGINIKSLYLNFARIWNILNLRFQSINALGPVTIGNIEVYGKYGSYAYVRFFDDPSSDGFIRVKRLKKTIDSFLNLSSTDMDVWANGVTYAHRKLTTTYKGDVEWIYDDNGYFTFEEKTGQIVGKVPGKTATITAKADGETATCTIHLLYKWEQAWTGKTNRKTNLYYAVGNGYSKGSTSLPTGTEFVVEGDCGTSNGWAYGYYQIGETKFWGYIPISHLSTKGTVSQYNSMNFRWPVDDVNINKISSPYGPRSSNNGGNHKGFDITTSNSGEIEGKPVVASYNGTIMKIYIDNNKKTSHGNAIVITTDKIDPISGKNLTVIYMHLSRWDTNSSGNIVVNGKVLKEGGSVTKEQIIGCAGNTGYNTSGAHLHYEVNNQNAAIRSGDNNPFTQTINPIYFYRDKSIIQSTTCEAYSNGIGFYWYGENN